MSRARVAAARRSIIKILHTRKESEQLYTLSSAGENAHPVEIGFRRSSDQKLQVMFGDDALMISLSMDEFVRKLIKLDPPIMRVVIQSGDIVCCVSISVLTSDIFLGRTENNRIIALRRAPTAAIHSPNAASQ